MQDHISQQFAFVLDRSLDDALLEIAISRVLERVRGWSEFY